LSSTEPNTSSVVGRLSGIRPTAPVLAAAAASLPAMSEPARAVLLAGLIGIAILLGPVALAAAGVIDVGAMFAVQAGLLLAIYLLAVVLRNRRDED
jgi:hypothetical protein